MSSVCEIRCRANQSYVGEELCDGLAQANETQTVANYELVGQSTKLNKLITGGVQSMTSDDLGVIAVSLPLTLILNPLVLAEGRVRTDFTLTALMDTLRRLYGQPKAQEWYWEDGKSGAAHVEEMVGLNEDGDYTRITLESSAAYDLQQRELRDKYLTQKSGHPAIEYLVEYEFRSNGTLFELRVVKRKFQAQRSYEASPSTAGPTYADILERTVVSRRAYRGQSVATNLSVPGELVESFAQPLQPYFPDRTDAVKVAKRRAIVWAILKYQGMSPDAKKALWAPLLHGVPSSPVLHHDTSPPFVFVGQAVAKALGVDLEAREALYQRATALWRMLPTAAKEKWGFQPNIVVLDGDGTFPTESTPPIPFVDAFEHQEILMRAAAASSAGLPASASVRGWGEEGWRNVPRAGESRHGSGTRAGEPPRDRETQDRRKKSGTVVDLFGQMKKRGR